MTTLSQFISGQPLQMAMQNGMSKYVNSATLVANVATTLQVPTDENGIPAKYVSFGRGQATTDNFYARCFNAADSVDRTTNGDFAEYVTNGAFASDTGWTKGTGWTITGGAAVATGAISTVLTQPSAITLIPGQKYTITFDATQSAGSVKASIGGTLGTARSTSATFKEVLVAGSDGTIAFTGNGFTGTIDNVTVTAWTLGTGWTTDGATAIATGAISTALTQTANVAYPLVAGQAYLVKFTATQSAGSVAVSLGGGTAGTSRSSSATFSEVIVAGSSNQTIAFTGSGFTGTIDNVSILSSAQVPSNVTNGLGSEQNPLGYSLGTGAGAAATISIVSAATPIITASFYK
jgi:hypothetical protein